MRRRIAMPTEAFEVSSKRATDGSLEFATAAQNVGAAGRARAGAGRVRRRRASARGGSAWSAALRAPPQTQGSRAAARPPAQNPADPADIELSDVLRRVVPGEPC